MRFAYADPPYLGCGKLYADRHPDAMAWNDIETHRRLVDRLCNEYPDGWAMSLSATSLKPLLALCPDDVHVAAWSRPNSQPFYPVRVVKSWEPVIFRGGRKLFGGAAIERDILVHPFVNQGLIGSKPRKFCRWIFGLLGAARGDVLDDLFPGTQAISAAWADWAGEKSPLPELPLLAAPELSPPDGNPRSPSDIQGSGAPAESNAPLTRG